MHNAAMLLEQMGVSPSALVTTYGPDIRAASDFRWLKGVPLFTVPYLFSWFGKRRWLNPFKALAHVVVSLVLVLRLRPKAVVSLGATNVVVFCVLAKVLGAKLIHVECMNQVRSRSHTGTLLYPFCAELFVQWPELLPLYGPKARYAGWVL